ncbi:ferredoxin-fold anticodon-binding domain-containing protein 1-like [Dreissena polymorpha]|uniref:FDX-ACB domain-containing protein n=1 Tax=Dreissena polymorpha TaxID=45954 RepID=A0A9D4N5K6_DREPO|nr:ferredoxin-fold anticodon-binding domain-containing protein 1-like [Dreissena polymorpha]XP_052233672.1 ferredoxin-fold anticodon-binding domain-containing protein 1-like [Dreissena polymorpha]KAH3888278.1 hypothetical protein DPMN_012310 [Dreissena polymorpha]
MEELLGKKVLLVGEGDFSFAVSLWNRMLAQNLAGNCEMMATSLETEQSILKHHHAEVNMSWLTENGLHVKLNTDATQLHTDSAFQDACFDTIVFNFPHIGGKSNHKKNRKLLNDFFTSSSKLLAPEGKVLVTLCKGQGGTPADRPMRAWHDSWQVVSMAANASLVLKSIRPFSIEDYNTYSSTGFRSLDKGFHTDRALTHVFVRVNAVVVPTHIQDAVIDMHQQKFACPPYVVDKLKFIREINNNADHPVHRLHHHLTSLLHTAASSHGYTVVDQKLNTCPISQSFPQEDGTRIQKNSLFSSMLPPAEQFSLKEQYILPCLKTEECIDCPMLKLCDDPEHIEVFKGIMNVALISSPLELIQNVQTSNSTREGVFCAYGPLFTRCIITKELPVMYHTCIMFCIEDATIADSLNSDGNIVAKFTQMIKSRFEIVLCPVPEKQPSSLQGNVFVKIFDLVRTNTEEDEQTDNFLGCIYQRNICGRQRHVVVTLNLSKLSCDIFGIYDERHLWSVEPRTMKQFSKETTRETAENCSIIFNEKDGTLELNSTLEFPVSKFQTVSLYPMTYVHDMSFWEKDSTAFDELVFSDCIRDVAGDNVVSVMFLDGYKDSKSGRQSRCYRLVFQSADKAMPYDASWRLQSILRLYVQHKMGITLR